MLEKIEAKIKVLKQKERQLRLEVYKIENEVNKLKKELQKVCPHGHYKIHNNSYHDDRMTESARWKEKVCTRCEKVLATSSEQTVWTEFK